MSISKIATNLTQQAAEGTKKLAQTASKKVQPMIIDGSKKLTASLDSIATTMKAKIHKKDIKEFIDIRKHSSTKPVQFDIKAFEKAHTENFPPKAKSSDLWTLSEEKRIEEAIKKVKELTSNSESQKLFDLSTPEEKFLETVTGKKSGVRARESAQTFLEQDANKLADFVTGEKANKSAKESAVVFEFNGKTETENKLNQKELKEKLMDKFGDKLNENKKIQATKARLQEKYKK